MAAWWAEGASGAMVGELKTFGVEQGERGFLEREDDEPPQMHTFLRSLTWLVSHSFIHSFIHLHHSFIRSPARWAAGAPVLFPVGWVDGGVGRALHRRTAHLEKQERKGSWLWSRTDPGFHRDSWLSHL